MEEAPMIAQTESFPDRHAVRAPFRLLAAFTASTHTFG
jgi:hypothetical protein